MYSPVPSEKRKRQRENQMLRATDQEKTEQRGRRVKLTMRVVIIAALLVAAAFLYSTFASNTDPTEIDTAAEDSNGAGGGDTADAVTNGADGSSTSDAGSTSDSSTSAAAGEDDAATNDASTSDDATTTADAATNGAACPAEDGTSPQTRQFIAPPPLCINPDQLYAADFETTLGSFTLVLDPSLDLASVNNFVVLARYGAYDSTIFHRVISDFVVQGGDVELALGTGSPGYRFDGGLPLQGWYRVGSVAMANSGDPSSNGSQFFIITGPDGASLPPLYSPLGVVTQGIDVVISIDALPTESRARVNGTQAGDVPIEDVVATSVTIREANQADRTAYESTSN